MSGFLWGLVILLGLGDFVERCDNCVGQDVKTTLLVKKTGRAKLVFFNFIDVENVAILDNYVYKNCHFFGLNFTQFHDGERLYHREMNANLFSCLDWGVFYKAVFKFRPFSQPNMSYILDTVRCPNFNILGTTPAYVLYMKMEKWLTKISLIEGYRGVNDYQCSRIFKAHIVTSFTQAVEGSIRSPFCFIGSRHGMLGGLPGIPGRESCGAQSQPTYYGAKQGQPECPARPVGRILGGVCSLPLGAKIGITVILTALASGVWLRTFIRLLDGDRNILQCAGAGILGAGLVGVSGLLFW